MEIDEPETIMALKACEPELNDICATCGSQLNYGSFVVLFVSCFPSVIYFLYVGIKFILIPSVKVIDLG